MIVVEREFSALSGEILDVLQSVKGVHSQNDECVSDACLLQISSHVCSPSFQKTVRTSFISKHLKTGTK